MGNIPNTNTPNLILQSVGNGSNDSRWGTSGGGSTLPTGTGTGQMIWWNGTGWVVTITPTTGSYLYWNGTAWANAVAGDATSIDGYPVNVTGLSTSGQMLFWTNLGGTGQWVTTYVPTGTGSMLFWNGLSWESTSTTGIATGNVLVWNNTTSKWVPGNLTLAGDVTGSAGANTVVKIQNYPVNITGLTGTGGFMFYQSTGSQFVFSGIPTGTGSIMYWNGSGYVSTPPPGGTGYLQWTGSAYTFGTGGGGGGLTNNDAGNLYLATAQSQAPSGQRYPVDASGGSYVQNYAARGAMTYTTTGASAGLVVGTTGVYHITGQIAITPSAALSQLQAQIVAGGSQIATSQAGTVAASQNEYLQVSCDWYMTSGTLIQLAWYFVNASGGASRTLTTSGSNTFISAHLVSS